MQFLQDFFEPPPLSPDLEWMLQSSQVSETDLAVQLTQDYANRLYFLALIVLGDESAAARSVADSLHFIVRHRSQFWVQMPLRAWIYLQALNVIRRHTTPVWRFRRWLDHRRSIKQPSDPILALRLALLKLEQNLALAISLVYGHELPEPEAALVLGVSEDTLKELLEQARCHLPAHIPEEMIQAARLADGGPVKVSDPDSSSTLDSMPEQPRLQRWLLSQVLPNLARKAEHTRYRRIITPLNAWAAQITVRI